MWNLTLPHELIVEILLRLPVRSLLRFKCVCKSWLSLISDPQFAKSHFDLAASPTNRVIMKYTDGSASLNFKIVSMDIDASHHDDSASLNPSVNLSEFGADIAVLGSCRGFILLVNDKSELILWNPITGVHRRVPYDVNEFVCIVLFGIGYDPSTDDYLVVLLKLDGPNIEWSHGLPPIVVFSFKSFSLCKFKGNLLPYKDVGPISLFGSFLNGALHWLVISDDTKLHVILGFDLVEGSLFEIPLSNDLATELANKEYYLRVMGGCLSLCYSGESDNCAIIEIWIMKEYRVQTSWTKSFVLSVNGIPDNFFIPLCFTKSGGLFGSNGHQRLIKLDDKGELLEHHLYGSQENILDSDLWSVVYRESLLSFPEFVPGDFEEESEDDSEEDSEDH